MDRIFVQIASYRDPRLIETVTDAIEKASHPERIFFGICNQFNSEDEWYSNEVFDGDNFRVVEVDYRESNGACWARSIVQDLWRGEEFTLQLDSHHLFADGWDNILIDMYHRCPSDRPIITGYVPQCPANDQPYCQDLYEMLPHFELDSIIIQYKSSIRKDTGLKQHTCWSGHFMFTEGKYCEIVRYDPELYFIGEEVSMALRSFTHGYDMFFPDVNVVWHEYGREMRPKHWGDHNNETDTNKSFFILDGISKQKVKTLLLGGDVEDGGLGVVRTLSDFENASGICFAKSYVSSETIKFKEAPIFSDSSWRNVDYIKYDVRVDWSKHIDYLNEFNPSQIAVFIRDARLDFNCKDELITSGIISAQWTMEPTGVMVWPYRCDPLVWGKQLQGEIVGYDSTKVS